MLRSQATDRLEPHGVTGRQLHKKIVHSLDESGLKVQQANDWSQSVLIPDKI
jgi:hypothetical protein